MIIHIDMDAYFAAVEQLDDPALRGKPVIIGGSQRGVVSTASYEARVFGVHSAMPVSTARRLCPQGIFVHGHRARYVELSRKIMAALRDFSPMVEPASIDEAYLDGTGLTRLFGPMDELCARIKARIFEVTGGLTCSVGAAPVKFLAKICSDVNKPDGIFILQPGQVDDFLLPLAVGRLPGVGRRMVQSLRDVGIVTVAQLRRYSPEFLESRFGKWGLALHQRAHGIDPRPVAPVREAKSESAECTFEVDTRDRDFLTRMLLAHAERVGASLRKHGLSGRTITLKVKFADFQQLTRSRTLTETTSATESIFETGCALLAELKLPQPVRLIGLGVSGFEARSGQLFLPGQRPGGNEHATSPELEARRQKLDQALDQLRARFGKGAVQRGRLFTQANPQKTAGPGKTDETGEKRKSPGQNKSS